MSDGPGMPKAQIRRLNTSGPEQGFSEVSFAFPDGGHVFELSASGFQLLAHC